MRYEVYLDTVFLIQFVMNYCVLMLTASVMKLITSRLRIILAALVGALGSCFMFLPIGGRGYIKFLIFFLVIMLMMTRIAFCVRGMRQYLCMLLSITAAVFLLGGVSQWLMAILGGGAPVMAWLFFLLLIYVILQYALYQHRRQKSLFVPVTISFEDANKVRNKISVVALLDTGNRLREETTGKAVCILEASVTKPDVSDFYEVTYHSLGNETAKMNARVVPEMVIHTKEGDIRNREVMLALYPGKISKKGAYHMILHPEYMKED